MPLGLNKIKILFFIGTLRAGGKERRLIELLTYLKEKGGYEMEMVFTSHEIHYPDFFTLGIPYEVIDKEFKKNDPTIIYKFYMLCRRKKPHIIHSWGQAQSFCTLPAVIGQKIPLINSQITSAPPNSRKLSFENAFNQLIFRFSTYILSNSNAGLKAFDPPRNKSKLIYNGINFGRFENLPDKEQIKLKYNIKTPYTIVMIASISPKKDYGLFFRIAENILKIRNDISFIGAGAYYENDPVYEKIMQLTRDQPNLIFTGRIEDVEALVNACDIGVLFSPKGEGLSNTILEYMALGKPVIANDIGGNKEIIFTNQNGYLVQKPNVDEITNLILGLIDDKEKCERFGKVSKQIIKENFSIEKMGDAFEQVYQKVNQQRFISNGSPKYYSVK